MFFDNGSHQRKLDILGRVQEQLQVSGHIPLTPHDDRWKERLNYCLACGKYRKVYRYFALHRHFFGPQSGPSFLLCASCFRNLEQLTPARRILGNKVYIYLAQSFLWGDWEDDFTDLLEQIGPIIKEQRNGRPNNNRPYLYFPDGSIFQKLTSPRFG
ncbi:hypothetical protein K8R42_05410 [bacterium]|nr:hypothetical protein [bacterium]